MFKLAFTLNGKPVEVDVEPEETLLDVLRNRLHVVGVKRGCDEGECGACTALADGRLILTCLALAPAFQGKSITTVEGIGTVDAPHPLQRLFVEDWAVQCGYCTPGFIVAAKALLDRNPDPTENEVRVALSGNLCRCTGYTKIVKAVLDAASELRAAPVG